MAALRHFPRNPLVFPRGAWQGGEMFSDEFTVTITGWPPEGAGAWTWQWLLQFVRSEAVTVVLGAGLAFHITRLHGRLDVRLRALEHSKTRAQKRFEDALEDVIELSYQIANTELELRRVGESAVAEQTAAQQKCETLQQQRLARVAMVKALLSLVPDAAETVARFEGQLAATLTVASDWDADDWLAHFATIGKLEPLREQLVRAMAAQA